MPETLELVEAQASAAQPLATTRQPATADYLLQVAVERGADLAYVEKLMELKERHEATEARKAHAAAVAGFKSEAVTIIKGKLITDGPLKGKKHADLFNVVSAVTPALSLHGLSISWKLTKDDKDWLEVTCYLKHAAGHVESVSMGGAPDTGPGRNAIQARCSTKTYLERYTATAILGIAATDADDDGAGGASADPLEVWSGRAALAQSLGELDRVSKDGAKEFRGKNDVEAFKAFAGAVQERGAALRASGAVA
jgi:ERF superfamily